MASVIIPIGVLLLIILCKRIPKIGGNINIGLVLAGILALLLGGVYSPIDWIRAWIDGVDRIAWIICLALFGSIYAQTQVKLGVVDTVMRFFSLKFRNKPIVLIICIMLSLVVAGSLLGDAIAASTVIGLLTITTLVSVGLSGEKIAAIIVMGASLGSLMPPITQAYALSSALVGANPDEVLTYAYFIVAAIVVLVCIYVSKFMIKKGELSTDNMVVEVDENIKPFDIIKNNIKIFIPLIALIIIVVFRTISNENIRIDLVPTLLNLISIQGTPLVEYLSQITIIKGITNGIVLSIVFVTIVSFLFKEVRTNSKEVIVTGLKDVKVSVVLQICAGFMLGAFYMGGQIETVQEFATTLSDDLVKFGGAGAMSLVGMLTGSQTTAQNAIFSSLGPTLVHIGVDETFAAIAGANLAASGQGLPPADLTTFCVVGIVGGIMNEKIDPIKVMMLALPMCLLLFAVGVTFLYI